MTYANAIARRLAAYKAEAAKSEARRASLLKNYPNAHPAFLQQNGASSDWRDYRHAWTTPAGRIETARNAVRFGDPTPNPADRPLYADSFDALGWRQVGTSEEVCRKEGSRRVDHSGWFVDSFQCETVSGHVLQLPARSGLPQYVAAVQWSDRDGVTVWPNRVTDSPLDAAAWADQEAKRIGEEEREYSEAYEAGRRYAERMAEAREARKERRELRKALKAERIAALRTGRAPSPVVCAALREKLESLYREGRAAYDKAAELLSNHEPWTRPAWADSYQAQHGRDPFPNGNPAIDRIADAFATGAADNGEAVANV